MLSQVRESPDRPCRHALRIVQNRPWNGNLIGGREIAVENGNTSDLVPLYLYDGKRPFEPVADVNVDLLARYRFDRLETEASRFYQGMDDWEQTVEGGLSIRVRPPWGIVSADALADMLGRHDGQAYHLSYMRSIRAGRWTISPSPTLVHQSAELVAYFYFQHRRHPAQSGNALYRLNPSEAAPHLRLRKGDHPLDGINPQTEVEAAGF